MRQETGIGTYGAAAGVSDDYILLEMRDLAAATIVHESMHAVDFQRYTFGTDTLVAQRETLMDLSWTSYDQPKDAEKISILSLASTAPASARERLRAALRDYAGARRARPEQRAASS